MRIIVLVTIYRRRRIGRDGHLDQSKACDTIFFYCNLYDIAGPGCLIKMAPKHHPTSLTHSSLAVLT